jgi:phenylpropionate dioxygenase-like ring-hydroxylating dioxygenase large terminal subunit
MNIEKTHSLIERLLQHLENRTQDVAVDMMTEDVADFFSAERFAREKDILFRQSPQVIGFAGEVRPGQHCTTEVMGVPVLVTRDTEGVLRAMINACAHRGAKVAQGRGDKARLICGFHGWAYSLDGNLYGRPQDQCFTTAPAQCGLTQLPVSDRSGLIVVGIDPAMAQEKVDNHLVDIEAEFSGFGFQHMHALETRRFEVKANWKLVAALSYESYHFANLHRDTVAQWLHPNCVHDFFNQRHSRWSFCMKGTEKLRERPKEKWPAAVPGAVSHQLYPGTVMITNPEDAQIIRTEPGATVDSAVVYYTGVFRDETKREQAQFAYDFGGKAFENEDLPAAIQCQTGLVAGRQQFFVGSNEPVVQFWHRLWREALER